MLIMKRDYFSKNKNKHEQKHVSYPLLFINNLVRMKRFVNFFLISAITFSIMGCVVAQNTEQQKREIAPFNAVKVSSGITLFLTQGEENNVIVEANGSIIEDVITKTEEGILKIYISSTKKIRINNSVKVHVTFSWINSIEASAGSEVIGKNKFMVEKLFVDNSSGSSSNFEIECRDLEIQASSGASIDLKGSSLNLTAKSNSGSSINSMGLKTVNAKLEASSGSDIEVSVSGELEASASSGASIEYFGEAIPKILRHSSGGDIQKR